VGELLGGRVVCMTRVWSISQRSASNKNNGRQLLCVSA
jgi:hypothetical protein